ncbi:DUF3089 domain-containing protein [Parvularcula maris]|uniref:DUF3089 domain-containing protein n=1 Tax=Parvularcula maris TaxID=2965077 RepID=A0A9X2RHJ5_9PROT|nr:DUF3089 domain-containing protein [Parvularcula maris]MCQ8185010.1 DUF3089 domain-containing protein [Parvularcula maris]
MAKRHHFLWALAGFVLVCALAAGLVLRFERQITLTFLNPDRTYEAYTPPPAPYYEEDDAWFLRGEGSAEAAAFVVHANVFRSSEEWNAPVSDTEQELFLQEKQVPADTSPFAGIARLHAPRYRQPTLYSRFTQKHPGTASRHTAYEDIEAAFDQFLVEVGTETPIILAGYDDGALLIGRLFLRRVASDEALSKRVAGVYAVGLPLTRSGFAGVACEAPDEPRCVVAFVPVDERFEAYRERLTTRTLAVSKRGEFVPSQGAAKLCAPPPLSEKVQAFVAGSPGLSFEPEARCEDGLLLHGEPPSGLRRPSLFGGPWYPDGKNLFAGAIREDAERRLEALAVLRAAEAEEARKKALIAPPMAPVEDLREVPVNKVPGGG